MQRYEREAPGNLMHVDMKKLGRIVVPGHRITGNPHDRIRDAGWEVAHVAIDDHSRVGFVQIHPDEKRVSALAFLHATVAHYRALGAHIKRLITDNGPAYRSRRFAQVCRDLGSKYSFTRHCESPLSR